MKDCHDAKWLIQAVRQDGRGFTDVEERADYQRAIDHAINCGCLTCRMSMSTLVGYEQPVAVGSE